VPKFDSGFQLFRERLQKIGNLGYKHLRSNCKNPKKEETMSEYQAIVR
jgi:hypothetical protein